MVSLAVEAIKHTHVRVGCQARHSLSFRRWWCDPFETIRPKWTIQGRRPNKKIRVDTRMHRGAERRGIGGMRAIGEGREPKQLLCYFRLIQERGREPFWAIWRNRSHGCLPRCCQFLPLAMHTSTGAILVGQPLEGLGQHCGWSRAGGTHGGEHGVCLVKYFIRRIVIFQLTSQSFQ